MAYSEAAKVQRQELVTTLIKDLREGRGYSGPSRTRIEAFVVAMTNRGNPCEATEGSGQDGGGQDGGRDGGKEGRNNRGKDGDGRPRWRLGGSKSLEVLHICNQNKSNKMWLPLTTNY